MIRSALISVIIDCAKQDIKIIVTDTDINKVFNRGIYLRGFYNSLSPLRKHEIDISAGTTVKLTKRSGGALYYVVLKNNVMQSVIAHEVFHLTMRLLGDRKGVNIVNEGNEEKYAYLLQDIYSRILISYNTLNRQ